MIDKEVIKEMITDMRKQTLRIKWKNDGFSVKMGNFNYLYSYVIQP